MLIDTIKREHGYMLQLFILLEHKCERLKEGKDIDYSVVYDVLWYLQNHSETIHHPKEDVVYRYYIDKYGDRGNLVNLIEEHHRLNEVTQQFSEIVEIVLQDSIYPKDKFIQNMQVFIQEQRAHLMLEEEEIFPKLLSSLKQKNLDEIDKLWIENYQDPLFGSHVEKEYYRLAERLAEDLADYMLEKECHPKG